MKDRTEFPQNRVLKRQPPVSQPFPVAQDFRAGGDFRVPLIFPGKNLKLRKGKELVQGHRAKVDGAQRWPGSSGSKPIALSPPTRGRSPLSR